MHCPFNFVSNSRALGQLRIVITNVLRRKKEGKRLCYASAIKLENRQGKSLLIRRSEADFAICAWDLVFLLTQSQRACATILISSLRETIRVLRISNGDEKSLDVIAKAL